MSNIVFFTPPDRIGPLDDRIAALATCFAECRRSEEDVFWLKENAELLNILECTGTPAGDRLLTVYAPFYDAAPDRLQFFPQYYRFLLSMMLDLEDLGMPGGAGEAMVQFAARRGLARAEMSDLQRAEAQRLMRRRGATALSDPGLDDRLRAFAARSDTFALPNKKAAYELTHIVYYLGEYGRHRPDLPQQAVQSLHFAGLIALLDCNADLLAEICIALVHLGETPPHSWVRWLQGHTARFEITGGAGQSVQDGYHEYLVCNWAAATLGAPIFRHALTPEQMHFASATTARRPLHEMSRALMALDGARHPDWDVMRPRLENRLSEEAANALDTAARSSTHFDAFFAGFARAGLA